MTGQGKTRERRKKGARKKTTSKHIQNNNNNTISSSDDVVGPGSLLPRAVFVTCTTKISKAQVGVRMILCHAISSSGPLARSSTHQPYRRILNRITTSEDNAVDEEDDTI